MIDIKKHIIQSGSSARDALRLVDQLGQYGSVLFVVDKQRKLLGSISDGDIRRGLLKNLGIDDQVDTFMEKDCHYINSNNYTAKNIKGLKLKQISFVPRLDKQHRVEEIIDISVLKSKLPLHAIIMAGGRGERLMPLTRNTPKPLLPIGDKPLMELNIDFLMSWGIEHFTITLRHLGGRIIKYFGDGSERGISIKYVTETKPLGTMGAAGLIKEFKHENVLLMNADLLTNFDLEHLYQTFLKKKADMLVASIPYYVNIPYAIVELDGANKVKGFKEKPRYTFQSNAGIYLMKKELLKLVPKNKRFDATDLMHTVIQKKMHLVSESINGYWMDIGNMADYTKAQEDIKTLKF